MFYGEIISFVMSGYGLARVKIVFLECQWLMVKSLLTRYDFGDNNTEAKLMITILTE